MEYNDYGDHWIRATEQQQADASKGNKLVLKDVVLDTINKPTTNGTYYSWSDMEKGLEKFTSMINKGQGYLFVDHPKPTADNVPIVVEADNLIKKAGMRVTKINYSVPTQPNTPFDVIVDLNVLDTSVGKDIRACLEDGGSIGFSKRGGLREWQETRVNEQRVRVPVGYIFVGYDAVIGQSVQGADTASGKIAYENQQKTNKEVVMLENIKTADDLKQQVPAAVYENICSIVKAELEAKTSADKPAMEAEAKTKLDAAVAEAVKPLNDKIVEQDKAIKAKTAALESVIPILVDAGLIDQREPSQVETDLQAKVDALEAEKKTLADKVAVTETANNQPVTEETIKTQVEQAVGDKPFKDAIFASLTGRTLTGDELKVALESATAIAEVAAGKGIIANGEQERTEQANQTATEQESDEKYRESLKARCNS